ncbi:hypothetical protein QQF64_018624 [Cirrhinus molitorella]|uniref:Uncharacterized protein n=1 Tax=Cirrhinus molitorella TaxID=172907 RepID=A0ABR3LD92_9TELE
MIYWIKRQGTVDAKYLPCLCGNRLQKYLFSKWKTEADLHQIFLSCCEGLWTARRVTGSDNWPVSVGVNGCAAAIGCANFRPGRDLLALFSHTNVYREPNHQLNV